MRLLVDFPDERIGPIAALLPAPDRVVLQHTGQQGHPDGVMTPPTAADIVVAPCGLLARRPDDRLIPRGGAVQSMGRYEFRVAERLSPAATAVFPELEVAEPGVGMVLFGAIRDRSELLAILERFELMGLTMLDVHRLPD